MADAPVKQAARREVPTVRESGRSLFPVSRVQKIIKADKDLPIVAKEAVFLISVAAEEFIKRICSASQKQAQREKRTTVQKKDLAAVVKRADEFFFLEDFINWEHEEQPIRKSKKATGPPAGSESGAAPLSRFVHASTKTGKDQQLEDTTVTSEIGSKMSSG